MVALFEVLVFYKWLHHRARAKGKRFPKKAEIFGVGVCPYLDSWLLSGRDYGLNKESAILADTEAECAVSNHSRGGILQYGLGPSQPRV